MTIPETLRLAPGEIVSDFSPRNLFETVSYGAVVGVLNITTCISLMALIFRGELVDALPIGIGLGLFGSLIVGCITALTSSFRGMVAGVQDTTAAVAGIAALAIATEVDRAELVPTVIALLFVASLVSGLLMLFAGRFGLGGLVRFLPHPVVGGFQVATGVLIFIGAVSILIPGGSSAALTRDSLVLWVPGVVVGLLLYALTRSERSRSWIAFVIVGAIGLGHSARVLAGIDINDAQERGWLFGSQLESNQWRVDSVLQIADANWGAVARQSLSVATIAILGVLSLSIRAHALDNASGAAIDVDQELEVGGWSSLGAMVAGAPPGYMFFSNSLLIRSLSGPRRGTALLSVLFISAALVAGSSVLTAVPVAVMGALLVYQSLSFTVPWIWEGRRTLDRLEYALVLGSGLAVILLGFLWAVALGTVAALGLFVFRYSRINAIKNAYDLRSFRSAIDRSAHDNAVLEAQGIHAAVFELDGFLFFGTAHTVFTDPRILAPTEPLRYAIFDLRRVSGLDSSASVALAKLARHALESGPSIFLAGPHTTVEGLLAQVTVGAELIYTFPTLDEAVAACEERLLERQAQPRGRDTSLRWILTEALGAESANRVLVAFERRTYEVGEIVVSYGAEASGLFFLDSGSLVAQLPRPGGPPLRLRTMMPATLLGEIGLYRAGPSSAEVIASEDSSVLHISAADLAALELSDPASAAAIHRLAAQTLAGRVLFAEQALRTLRDS